MQNEIIQTVEVAGKQYNITQAPAVKQKTLMSLVAAAVTLRRVQSDAPEISTQMLLGVLMALPESTLDQIDKIVLSQCIENGGENKISINDFQGQMQAYFTLLAEGLRVNLADFFTWLDAAAAGELKKNPSK